MWLPGPSTSDNTDEESNAICGKETYKAISRLLKKLEEEKTKTTPSCKQTALERTEYLTGLHPSMIRKLKKDFVVKKIEEIDRKLIHDTLMEFYIQMESMPTATNLYNVLAPNLPPYEDITTFRTRLVKMGYIFKRKGPNNVTVVIENPSVRFERYLYLKKIIKYRNDLRNIYFVGEAVATSISVISLDESRLLDDTVTQHRFMYVVNRCDVLFYKDVEEFNENNFEKWILDDVIPNLKSDSIIVLDDSKHHCQMFCNPPNRSSLKVEMMEWLDYHQIPYNADKMNRVDLFTLVERLTDIHQIPYKIDYWLKQRGHVALRLPSCVKNMSPAAFLRSLMNVNGVDQFKTDINVEELFPYNMNLIEEERRLLSQDQQLDIALQVLESDDNAVPLNVCEPDSSLPALSDSDDD